MDVGIGVEILPQDRMGLLSGEALRSPIRIEGIGARSFIRCIYSRIIRTPKCTGRAADMVEMGVEHPDRPAIFQHIHLTHRTDAGEHSKIRAAARPFGMLGKPECLAAEQLRIVVPQQDSRLFIVAVTFAAVPKDAVSPGSSPRSSRIVGSNSCTPMIASPDFRMMSATSSRRFRQLCAP